MACLWCGIDKKKITKRIEREVRDEYEDACTQLWVAQLSFNRLFSQFLITDQGFHSGIKENTPDRAIFQYIVKDLAAKANQLEYVVNRHLEACVGLKSLVQQRKQKEAIKKSGLLNISKSLMRNNKKLRLLFR